jgi:hypothetical protein
MDAAAIFGGGGSFSQAAVCHIAALVEAGNVTITA